MAQALAQIPGLLQHVRGYDDVEHLSIEALGRGSFLHIKRAILQETELSKSVAGALKEGLREIGIDILPGTTLKARQDGGRGGADARSNFEEANLLFAPQTAKVRSYEISDYFTGCTGSGRLFIHRSSSDCLAFAEEDLKRITRAAQQFDQTRPATANQLDLLCAFRNVMEEIFRFSVGVKPWRSADHQPSRTRLR